LEDLMNIDLVHCSCLSSAFVKSILEVHNMLLANLRELN
jgi:hypothetical protein